MHEIPVGPVHAGIIEPGDFRFQVVGEKILWLEARLGYKHKGIENASKPWIFWKAPVWPGGSAVIAPWRMPLPMLSPSSI